MLSSAKSADIVSVVVGDAELTLDQVECLGYRWYEIARNRLVRRLKRQQNAIPAQRNYLLKLSVSMYVLA
jgi:hypothetical protein